MGQDRQQQLRRARLVAGVAATIISLACGTNYVYSAWAPQFAEKLKLSATQSNLIGQFGNLGLYSLGIPVGIFVDHRGPRPFVLIGAVLLAVGYFPLHMAYDSASGSIVALCFFSFLSGLGSCLSFAAAVKTSALNWPSHRGTATAFPLAAFGLSAFFFSSIGALLFPGDPSAFLKLLSCGTFGLTFAGFFFLRVYPHSNYHTVINPEDRRSSSLSDHLRPSQGWSESLGGHLPGETGTSSIGFVAAPTLPSTISSNPPPGDTPIDSEVGDDVLDEASILISSAVSEPVESVVVSSVDADRSHRIDIRGLKLLGNASFWQLFAIMAILSGIGLMTINNIGNDVNVLWKHRDQSLTEDFLVHQQQMHVSILSLCSFVGRLFSGVGSDFLVRSLHASRMWCLLVASVIFLLAQACALVIENPHLLGLVSGLSGLGYGFLFGVFPSLVTEAFGIRGLSQNWGFMTLAPVISSNIFNSFYGLVLDSHSVFDPSGERSCHEGLDCYRAAYWVAFGACSIGIAITLWTVQHERVELARERKP
ncbi:hypothetical protein C2857_001151 [Epichloe festucae Fl1]|uniref:Nodulin-like domain-containing protein n=1 Tax=Epichloe festucae (strain Fl1) TaxID=877507 RepID=A0A7U3Q0X5_EPIFF|nr:hypothetical protein C2857_001151 [Epichloe festucae Fl1]